MKATTNHYVARATTTRLHTMAVVNEAGVGRSKSLGISHIDRRGQFCTRAREIRQGG